MVFGCLSMRELSLVISDGFSLTLSTSIHLMLLTSILFLQNQSSVPLVISEFRIGKTGGSIGMKFGTSTWGG